RNLMRFYHHESCGQCTPCREGTGWLPELCDRLIDGKGSEKDAQLLGEVQDNIMGTTLCALGDGTAMPVLGFVKKYRQEFHDPAKHGVKNGRLDKAILAAMGKAA